MPHGPNFFITSQMIYHRGGEAERAMHCWFNVMPHKPWITACRICHLLMFHERRKQYFVQPFFRSMKLLRLHTRLHTQVMSWISRACECRLCMDLPEANSTTSDLSLSVSSLHLSVKACSCHACVNLSCLCCLCSLHGDAALWQWSFTDATAGHIACTKLPEDVWSSCNI